MAKSTQARVKALEAQRAKIKADLDKGRAGPRHLAEAQMLDIDTQIAGLSGLTVDQLRKMRGG